MTTFQNTGPSDVLRFHDVLRVTFSAPSHWFETKAVDSQWFGAGLGNIYDTIDQLGVHANTLNPYVAGSLAAVVDFLHTGSGDDTVAALMDRLLRASRGTWFGIPTNPQDLVTIDTVRKVVGTATGETPGVPPPAAPGTEEAYVVAFSPQAVADRTEEQQAADVEKQKNPSWWDDLKSEALTGAKIVVGVIVIAIGYGLYRRSKG